MQVYGHGGDIFSHDVRVDYSVNINPFGMLQSVKQAVISHMSDYETYPDPYCRKLRAAIAKEESVEAENIVCGNGAAELIYRLCLSQRPERVLVCAPTFSDYARGAELSGARVTGHTLYSGDGFMLSEEILADITPDVDMLFLCNPNNPTGRLIDNTLIERILERSEETGTAVVVDECFLPFTQGRSVVAQIRNYANLIVIKAFTKIYAMAGLRLGYMISGNTGFIRNVGDFGQCWNVSAVAQVAGLAALKCCGEADRVCRFVQSERRYLSEALENIGIQVFPSDANFLLIRSDVPLYDLLLRKGILIRKCGNFPGLDDSYYRIAVKLHEHNEMLVSALNEVLIVPV